MDMYKYMETNQDSLHLWWHSHFNNNNNIFIKCTCICTTLGKRFNKDDKVVEYYSDGVVYVPPKGAAQIHNG